jgi:hypothetical protein
MWSCVLRQTGPEALEDHSTFTFRIHQSKNPGQEGTTILPHITNCSPNSIDSHPKRMESSETLLWQPQISQHYTIYVVTNNRKVKDSVVTEEYSMATTKDLYMLDISDDHGDSKLKLINQCHSKSNLRPEVNTERCLVFCLQQYSTQWSKAILPRKMLTKFLISIITIWIVYTS